MDRLWPITTIIVCFIMCGLHGVCQCSDSSYESVNQLMQDLLLNNSEYNKYLRPVNNQSHAITLYMSAQLLTISQVNDVDQTMSLNAFFGIIWRDERLIWDPNQYGQVDYMAFDPKSIWKPQFFVHVSSKRLAFSGDESQMTVNSEGFVTYVPGGTFITLCQVNMEKFPFDSQECGFTLCPVGYTNDAVLVNVITQQLLTTDTLSNEEWEYIDAHMVPFNYITHNTSYVPCVEVLIKLKRRPTFMIVNIVLPIVFLSFINGLSFVIPVDSGEKISFAITLLLALSVYMTQVSDLVPRSSNNVPALTIYLFILLTNSLLTVVVTVIIVYMHHYREKANEDNVDNNEHLEQDKKKKFNLALPSNKVHHHNDSISPSSIFPPLSERKDSLVTRENSSEPPTKDCGIRKDGLHVKHNKIIRWSVVTFLLDHSNVISFCFFTMLWTCSTVAYFGHAMS